jgi:hypothetical protein
MVGGAPTTAREGARVPHLLSSFALNYRAAPAPQRPSASGNLWLRLAIFCNAQENQNHKSLMSRILHLNSIVLNIDINVLNNVDKSGTFMEQYVASCIL